MKLVRGKKLEKNLKLMRSCSQVKIIQLTEEIAKLIQRQKRLIERNPDLRNMLASELNRQLSLDGNPTVVNPQTHDLIGIPLPDYTPSIEESPEVNQYMTDLKKVARKRDTLADHQTLNEILAKDTISYREFSKFINSKDTTRMFKRFVTDMRQHSPLLLSSIYKLAAKDLAERNDLANTAFLEKTDNVFTLDEVNISLSKDLRGRFFSAGKKLVASIALSAALVSGASMLLSQSVDTVPGITDPHTSSVEPAPNIPSPVIAVSPEETPSLQNGVFSNSININSFKTACDDFFQKTAEIYKFNTGEDIDLTGYEQNDIGINRSARILEVEKDGVIYRISTQSSSPSGPTYLREALDALGVSYTEYSSRTTCIIDKYDDTKSIAIVDSQGNPIRSGNILEPTGNGGDMYNQQMVQNGRKILEAEGRDTSSLSEGACVAAYILSDSYNTQNPELSRALGVTAGLADTIKTTFYSHGGKDDNYAIYLYAQDSAKLAQSFNSKEATIDQDTNSSHDVEHDER